MEDAVAESIYEAVRKGQSIAYTAAQHKVLYVDAQNAYAQKLQEHYTPPSKELASARLERLIRAAEPFVDSDPTWATVYLKASESWRKLHGLDAKSDDPAQKPVEVRFTFANSAQAPAPSE